MDKLTKLLQKLDAEIEAAQKTNSFMAYGLVLARKMVADAQGEDGENG